jgi:hypothetical protein
MPSGAVSRSEVSTRHNPPVVTVHRAHDGSLGHTRCSRSLRYMGARGGGRELDFYCQTCHEHVTLPQLVVFRMLDGGRPDRRQSRRRVILELEAVARQPHDQWSP